MTISWRGPFLGDNPLVGLFLPYTPLHHILLRETGRPLVMTSGNVSDEPMVYRDRDALGELGTIADLFLTHNREIESRVDDSVVRVIDISSMYFVERDHQYINLTRPPGMTFRQYMKQGFGKERATVEDWTNHLTTIFTEVRLKKYIEVRSADSQPPAC